MRAEALPTWIEPGGGDQAMKALASDAANSGGSLPCTLVVDGVGRVRGRMLGARFPTVTFAEGELGPGGKLTDAAKRRLASAPSVFAVPEGPAFLQLLADGALERPPA